MRVLENLNFGKAFRELLPNLLGEAFQIVIIVTVIGFLLAIVIGFILALGKICNHKVIRGIILVFDEIIRGTPLLVQLVYVFYAFPLIVELIMALFGVDGYKMDLTPTTAGIIGLSINYGTYLSEVIRSSILSIDRGQTEAALALGFSPRQTMMRIVIPQAFKSSIPVFGNYLVMMVKDTSLMAYITAQEFLMTTRAYTAQTFLTIESYTIVALVYLVICFPLSTILKYLEQRLNRGRR